MLFPFLCDALQRRVLWLQSSQRMGFLHKYEKRCMHIHVVFAPIPPLSLA